METKDIIARALNYYLVYIQTGKHNDGERRKCRAIKCISYINNGGTVDRNWLIGENLFFIDVFNKYSSFLDDEMQNAIPNDKEIEKLKTEQSIITMLLKALKQVFGIS